MATPMLTSHVRLIERPAEFSVLLGRERFVEVLDQKEHKLKQVLTDYSFPTLVPCGLANCRTPHRDGFLVETEDGLETNVGHVCGRRAFGKSFDIARSAYQRLRDLQDLRDRARALTEQLPDLERRVDDLYTTRFGVRWIERIRAALDRLLGHDLFDDLCVFQRRGDLEVYEERERTKAEIDRIVEQTRQKREQVRFERRMIGRLEPMPWATFDFKGQLRMGLVEDLRRLSLLDLERVETPVLRARVKKLDGVEDRMSAAQDAITAAARFFEPSNLQLLALWVPQRNESRRKAVLAWLDSDACKRLAAGERD